MLLYAVPSEMCMSAEERCYANTEKEAKAVNRKVKK